jgi:hypothetical protein
MLVFMSFDCDCDCDCNCGGGDDGGGGDETRTVLISGTDSLYTILTKRKLLIL